MSLPITSPDEAIDRARSALGKKTEYKLGKGGMNPKLATPSVKNQCDCTGFLAWAFGISRHLKDNPYYIQLNGGWFETTAIFKDVNSPNGIFTRLDAPRVGAIAVYGDSGGSQGHIGLITEVSGGKVKKVIHCSLSAWNNQKDSIQENSAKALTDNPAVNYGWFSGYSDASLIPLTQPVSATKSGGKTFRLAPADREGASLLPSALRGPGKVSSPAHSAPAPGNPLKVLFTIGNPPKYIAWHFPGENTFFYQSHATINADGAPNAYNETDTGIDWLLNAGAPTRKLPNGKPDKSQPHHLWKWWALSLGPGNRPYKQTPGQPFPGHYISMTALVDGNKPVTDPARYVDSNSIPFLVLPGGQYGGAKKGDLGWIINRKNGKATGAIFADVGPAGKLGELSIHAADLLGLNSNPKNGGTSRKDILYIVFPGSGTGKPVSASTIQTKAKALFTQWGGDARVGQLPPLV
jgi:hypothetical protein